MRYLVLVVDDEQLIRDVLADVLLDEGFRVLCAEDGQAALDLAETEHPDLVVSDVHMPRMDGITLVESLRERGRTVPVILISALYAGVDVPGVRFLPEPFDLDHVVGSVERSLGAG